MARSVYVPQAGGFIDFKDDASDADITAYLSAKFPAAPAEAQATAQPAEPKYSEAGLPALLSAGFSESFTDIPGGISSIATSEETAATRASDAAKKAIREKLGIKEGEEWTIPQYGAYVAGQIGGFFVPVAGEAAIAGRVLEGVGMASKAARALLAVEDAATGAQKISKVGKGIMAVPSIVQGGAIQAEQTRERILQQREQGMEITPAQQLLAQRLNFAVGTAERLPLERIAEPLSQIFSKVPAKYMAVAEDVLNSRLSRLASAAGQEGLQEVLQGVASDLIEKGVYNPDVEIGQDLLSNAAGGAFGGSLVEGIVQLATGRRIRAYRQLQTDLAKELPVSTAARRQGEIAVAADTLSQAKVVGGVRIEEEEFDGKNHFVVKTPSGESVGSFTSPEEAQQAVELYRQRTGANVSIREPKNAPSVFPVRIGSGKFNSMDDITKARDSLVAKRDSIIEHISNPDLLNRVSAEQKVAPEFYKAKQQKDVEGLNKAIKRYDDFIAASSPVVATPAIAPAPKEVPVKDAPMSPAPTAPVPEAAAGEVDAEELASVPVEEEVAPEPIPEYSDEPIGAIGPEPAVSEAIYEEPTPATPPVAEAEAPPKTTVMRPSATADQLDALKARLFGESKNVRNMTPEELDLYNKERDKLYPPVEQTVYTSAAPVDVGPRTISEAVETGPRISEYNDATKKWYGDLLTGVQSRVNNILPGKAMVNFQQLVGADKNMLIRGQARAEAIPGGGIKSIIDLSTGILRPGMSVEDAVKELVKTTNHELIHVIRDQDLLRPEEWRILAKAVTGTKVPGRAYTYLDKAQAIYTPGGIPISEVYADPDAVVEEAVAELYKDWVFNGRTAPNTAGLFNRITEFFRRIFRALKSSGYEKVFKSIESGDVGRRESSVRAALSARYAVNPIFMRSNPNYVEEMIPGKRKKINFIPENMDAAASRQAFNRLNEAIRRYPDPISGDSDWIDNLAFAYNTNGGVMMPPGWLNRVAADIPSWAGWMKGLTPAQLAGVDSGFASIDAIAAAYRSGTTSPEFTGALLFWTYLSRMASSFPHESGVLDIVDSAVPFINKAINGTFTADPGLLAMTATGKAAKTLKENAQLGANSLPADIAVAGRSDLDDWFLMVRRTLPRYSPGNSVTNNINSYGRDFLANMSAPSPNGGESKLMSIHRLFASDINGPNLRREFHRIRDGAKLGFDNKILSFAILLSGRKDVLVLDRIQINQLFGGGQTNKIYDDVESAFNGPRGLAVYEALERGMNIRINDLYNAIGRPQDASLGRYHWESWIRSSGQIVSHPTIQGLVNLAQGRPNPFIDVGSVEGRYHRFTFGVKYMKRPNGQTEYVYTTTNGDEYSVSKSDLDNILKDSNLRRTGAIPKWFPGVSTFEGGLISWRDYPGVDILKIDNQIANAGMRIGNARPNQVVNQNTLGAQAADAARIARARAVHDASNRARWEFGREPNGGKPNARIPESYEGTVGGTGGRDVKNTFTPKDGVKRIFDNVKISAPTFEELNSTEENAKRFRDALAASKAENTHGAAVFVYEQSQYQNMRLFMTEDGTAGFALKGNDIVSVFNRASSPHKWASVSMIHLAVQLGGRKLDGFDTVLPGLYSRGGMTTVARTKFADIQGLRPDDWDYATFQEFNGGRPDVVFMVFDPTNWTIYKPTDGQLFTSNKADPTDAAYEAGDLAAAAQDAAVYNEPPPVEKAPKKGKARLSAESVDMQETTDSGAGDVVRFSASPIIPRKTVKAYKLFRTKKREPGKLFPLFVFANEPVPIGEWIEAKEGLPGKSAGKVKSKLGELAYRPGWHAGDLPIATHIGGRSHKDMKLPPDYRPDDQVWAEIEMPNDVDWQSVADSRAQYSKEGKKILSTAHITDEIPFGGFYRYKTNPNMTGNWMISGNIKVVRVLTDEEVRRINERAGVSDLPRLPRARLSAAPLSQVIEDPEEFRRWFRNSKIVNKDGSPKVVYHGTSVKQRFKAFNPNLSEMGSHFGTARQANDFTRLTTFGGSREEIKRDARIYPVYLSIQNPLRLVDLGRWDNDTVSQQLYDKGLIDRDLLDEAVNNTWDDPEIREKLIDAMAKAGHDGIVYLNRAEGLNKGSVPALEDAGFDWQDRETTPDNVFRGFVPEAEDSYIIFNARQVKSAFNQFKKGETLRTSFSAAPIPANIATANQSLFAPAKKNTILQTVSDFFFQPPGGRRILNTAYGPIEVKQRKYAGLQFRANVIDNNAVVEFLEKLKNEKTTGEYQLDLADFSATAALTFDARASQLAVSAILLGNLKVNFARPGDMQSAVVSAEENNDNLLSVFTAMLAPGPVNPTTGKQDNKLDIFRSYAVAIRGRNKKAAGEKVPAQLTDAYIRDTIAFTQTNYPEIVDAYNMYQRVNKRMMEAVRDSGRISDASFAALTRDMDYYGFFREAYEEELSPTTPSKTAADIKFREYTGSEAGNLLGDPIAVMIKNFQFLTSMATKNIATQKVFNLARDMGEARLLATGEQPDQSAGEAKEVMFFHERGVLKRFAVKDPLLVMALGSDPHVDIGGAMKLMGLPTRVIRESVTRDPGFMLANLLRDTVSAWITSGEDITPFLGTARGMVNALKSGTSFKALMAHGVVGSYDMAMKSADEVSAMLQRRIAPKNVHLIGSPQGLASATRMLWDKLGVLSEASDAATRIAVYEAAKAQGLSDAEAAIRAIRILDFSRHGGSQFLSMLTKLIPFLNARIQGLDVLYQAGAAAGRLVAGKSQSQRDANLGKKFLVRGAILAAISVALEAFNEDDEDYQNLPQYVKTGNLLIPLSPFGMKGQFIGIPKAFEPGLLFSTFPQQFYASMNGQASSRENINMFIQSFASTFGVNPLPQILMPMVEIATNHDFYTGLPLISEGKMRLSPELQYDSRTSTLSMMLGKIPVWYNMDTGKFTGISPIIIEKMVSGYTGPFGSMIVSATGMAVDGFDIGPERLPKSFAQLPVVRRVFIDAESKNPKAVTQAYELFRIVDEANRSFSRLRQTGDAEATMQFYEENQDVLSYKKYIFKMVDRLNKLSAYERQIERDQSMSREDKLAAMEDLRQARIQLTEGVKEINQKLGR